MDILAASYTNIGPFFDMTVSVIYRAWRFVINAPVWTWKSFLFFDWPIFSLYKHAPRPIRNRRSSTGQTQLVFSCTDALWIVLRNLWWTKIGGDSVKTTLYRYVWTKEQLDIILEEHDQFSNVNWYVLLQEDCEEILCANEKEVEHVLNDLLPPKEVVLSANFLMQDAVNVFELAPAQRLDIFKHIFWFIGIDHAKETLSTKRKEIQTRITVLQDTSDITHMFQINRAWLKQAIKAISWHVVYDDLLQAYIDRLLSSATAQDSQLLDTAIGIDWFSCDIDVQVLESLQSHIQQQVMMRNEKKWTYTQLLDTTKILEKDSWELQQRIQYMINELEKYDDTKKNIDDTMLKEAEEQMNTLVIQQEHYDVKKYIDILTTRWYSVDSFVWCVRVIDDIIAQWRELKQRIIWYDESLVSLEKQTEEIKERRIRIEKNIYELQKQHTKNMSFSCDMIDGMCPYVEMIKWVWDKVLQNQQERMKEELIALKKTDKEYEIKKEKLLTHKAEADKKNTAYRLFLQEISWKTCMEEYSKWNEITQQIHVLQKDLQTQHQFLRKQLEEDKKYADMRSQVWVLEEEHSKKMKQFIMLQEQVSFQSAALTQGNTESLLLLDKHIASLWIHIHDITLHTEQYKKRQISINQLEEELVRIKHLYTLFSKELLLYVLQDFLPNIESMMNTYLHDIADYTVQFSLDTAWTEKISLDIYVQDERGLRPVKSLSGWQKSLLKLAWILSIASLMKLPFLFLDETITSLDTATTADVAWVLDRFVQSYNIKFYVVTHAPQIQEMPIWDKEIRITSNIWQI